MASVPCDACHAPTRGRLAGIYPVLLVDDTRHPKYRRYCLPHMRDVVANHAKDWRDRALTDSSEESTTCFSCGTVLESSTHLARFYATAYLDGKNRRDFESQYCQQCLGAIIREFEFEV